MPQAAPSLEVYADAGLVASPQSGEDVVQDAWLAMLSGLAKFEGRSSLRTWVFTILRHSAAVRRDHLPPGPAKTSGRGTGAHLLRPAQHRHRPGHVGSS